MVIPDRFTFGTVISDAKRYSLKGFRAESKLSHLSSGEACVGGPGLCHGRCLCRATLMARCAVMMAKLTITAMLGFFPALVSLCVFMTSPVVAKDNTPTNKRDCLALLPTLYRKAESLSKRTKQIIPREFARVAANLDEFCGEENFEKARISINWMNTCLKNFTKD
jgi:hypothetical protein